jgi:CHAT domain-containing protein
VAHGESDLTPDPVQARLRAAAGRAGGGARRTPDCPDPADIATLVASDGEAAATFLSHASTCDDCGPLVDAAMGGMADRDDDRALLEELHTASPEWRKQMSFRLAAAGRKAPATSRRWVWAAAGVAAAAALVVVAIRVASPGATRPELQDLVAALDAQAQRPVDGRLTGGFSYAAPPTLLRGPTAPAPPRVRIAAAQLEEALRASDTATTQAAVGVGFLAVGELDKAVDALEGAVLQSPTDARYQSDLSAAYLARAKWMDRAEDWPKALAAAERAVKADPTLVEAQFNRALALEGLHLIDAAIEAWTSYPAIETEARWRAEAEEHARQLREQLAAPKPQSNQDVRERIEDELLAKWGEALLAGDPHAAARLLDEAEAASAQLVAAGGDAMARDEIALIRHSAATIVRSIARAHILFGAGRRLFLAERLRQAADQLIAAAREFRVARSPYANWGHVYAAMSMWVAGDAEAALRELESIPEHALLETHLHLEGRYYWTRASIRGMSARFDLMRSDLEKSVAAFRRGGEIEHLGATESGLAEARWILGERAEAWRAEASALSRYHLMPPGLRRSVVLREGAMFSLSQGLPEAALHFQDALVRSIDETRFPAARPDAYVRRARIHALTDTRAAHDDLREAEAAIATVPDPGFRDRNLAEVLRVRIELAVDPHAALAATDAALQYFRSAGPAHKVADLLVRRARLLQAQGNVEGARREFRDAVDHFEQDTTRLSSPRDRIQAFELRRDAYQAWIHLEIAGRSDPAAALGIAERARARRLFESPAGAQVIPLDPPAARERLPADLAVIYLVQLDDRVLAWVLTRDNLAHFSPALRADQTKVASTRIRQAIDRGASVTSIAPASAAIVREIVEPALEASGSALRLVFIADGELASIPFGVLPLRSGRPLLAERIVSYAPSVTVLLNASARLQPFVPIDVLAVGDGHDPSASGLSRLARADAEASAIARLYADADSLLGEAATAGRFFETRRTVIHFAGHAVANPEFPMFSRLLFATDTAWRGTVFAEDIAARPFDRARLVVLATCDGASGATIGMQGVGSLARAFIDAGVPAVVASLWPVDEAAEPLLVRFHRELQRRPDIGRALQVAQLSFLQQHGFDAPARVWAGFILIGGVTATP